MDKKLTKKQLNEINYAITNAVSTSDVKSILHDCEEFDLSAKTLGLAFEYLFIDNNFSREVEISELIELHHSYRTKNGATWNRKDSSYLGKKYNVISNLKNGALYSVRIDGENKRIKIDQTIPTNILKEITKQKCVILDIGTNIECDHKDGLKNISRMQNISDQRLEDYQPLCKTANMAKKSHCTICKNTGKRFDARVLGYSVGFTYGDENTFSCQGCYWFDPIAFNKRISKDFKG